MPTAKQPHDPAVESDSHTIDFGAARLTLIRQPKPAGYFAGDMASCGVALAFDHVLTGGRSGTLTVMSKGVQRQVLFRNGEIAFAASADPDERLGSILIRDKSITPAQLKEALLEVKPGTKLGQVLIHTGWMTAPAVYAAMTRLVREIVLGLFKRETGDFLFLEGVSFTDESVQLPQRSRELVLAAMRGDRPSAAQKAAEAEEVVVMIPADEPEDGEEEDQPKADSDDSHASIEIDEDVPPPPPPKKEAKAPPAKPAAKKPAPKPAAKPTPKAAAKPEAPKAAPERPALTEKYRSLVQTLCKAMRKEGKDLHDLKTFLAEPLPGMEDAFAGVTLTDDGLLDIDRVLKNCGAEATGRAQAFEALNSFVSYAIFNAKNVLPPDLVKVLRQEFARERE